LGDGGGALRMASADSPWFTLAAAGPDSRVFLARRLLALDDCRPVAAELADANGSSDE
jgi:hypothetical protein